MGTGSLVMSVLHDVDAPNEMLYANALRVDNGICVRLDSITFPV
jgi:hypothetical protein